MKETRSGEAHDIAKIASRIIKRIRNDVAIRSAAFSFALSRCAILIIFVLTTHLTIPTPPQTVGDYKNPNIVLERQTIRPKLAELAYYGDGGWYIGIVRNGYEKIPFDPNGQHNWAFFPLYPLLLRAAFGITGGVVLTGMALSSFLFFLALILLYKSTVAFGWDNAVADRAVFYLAMFPVSYFFSLPMTESLFLLLVIASIYAAKRDVWWLAGLLGAMASGTRVMGVILLPVLMILYWQQRRRRVRADVLALLLVPVGLLSFMYYLHSITGDALAFSRVLGSWGRKSGFSDAAARVSPPPTGNKHLLGLSSSKLYGFYSCHRLRNRTRKEETMGTRALYSRGNNHSVVIAVIAVTRTLRAGLIPGLHNARRLGPPSARGPDSPRCLSGAARYNGDLIRCTLQHRHVLNARHI